MFGLLRRARRPLRTPPITRARLGVEELERRDTPAAPSIMGLTATHYNNALILTGTVMDEHPENVSVSFGGAISGQVTTNATGSFSYSCVWPSGAQVTAQATDDESLTSSVANATLTQINANFGLTLSVSYGAQKQVTLSGHLTDDNVNGRMIMFTGAVTGSTNVNSSGDFSVTLTASSLGTVTASVLDATMTATATASVTLTSSVPVIQSFTCTEQANHWFVFTGTVSDESPAGLTIYFGGQPVTLLGKSTTTATDGSFSFSIQLNGMQSDEGTATANLWDWWGQAAAQVTCDVHQTGV